MKRSENIYEQNVTKSEANIDCFRIEFEKQKELIKEIMAHTFEKPIIPEGLKRKPLQNLL